MRKQDEIKQEFREVIIMKWTEWKTTRKTFMLGLCMCVSIMGLTACGKKEVTYEDLTTGESSSESGEKVKMIPEHIQQDIGLISIDADVLNAESYGNLSVAVVERDDFDEEDMKHYAETVFDEGSAEVVLPYKYCSKEFLQKEQSEVEARIKELGYTEETIEETPDYMYLGYQLADIRSCLEEYNGANVIENDGSYQFISAVFEDLEGIEMGVSSCQIKGTIDGKEYAMYFVKIDEVYSIMGIYRITEMQYAEKMDLFDEDPEPLSSNASSQYQENQCSLSQEEAVTQVEEYVSKLGIEDYMVTEAFPAMQHIWHYASEEKESVSNANITKGYLVYLGKAINGYTTPWINEYRETNCFMRFDGEINAIHEGIVVLVTDDGIERFQYVNPTKVTEITAEQATVMPFEDIHKKMMSFMEYLGSECTIDKIRLCMGWVTDGGSYAYIPVWCYESSESTGNYAGRNGFLVNAMDGSVIDAGSGIVVQK